MKFTAAACFGMLLPTLGLAAEPPIKHHIMFFEYGNTQNRFVELDEDGRIVWEFKPPGIAVQFQVLPNGNVLYAHGGSPTGVVEVNHKGEAVWKYDAQGQQTLNCEREPDGNTLVAEQGPPRAVEVNTKGEVVHATPLTTSERPFHRQVRGIHKLKNGNILAAHEGEGAVREYEPDGKVVWEYTGINDVGEAVRLDTGNTLISCATQKRLIEVTPEKKIVWEFKAADAPDLNLTWTSSIQVLPNGNYLIGNFLRGAEGRGAHALEITHDKRIVWTFEDHTNFKSLTTVRAVEDVIKP